MLKRNARLRREYLYRKSLEGAELEEYERKRKIRQALEGTQFDETRSALLRGCIMHASFRAPIETRGVLFVYCMVFD